MRLVPFTPILAFEMDSLLENALFRKIKMPKQIFKMASNEFQSPRTILKINKKIP